MTLILLLLGLLTLPSMLTLADDPAPGLLTSVESSRRLTCERASLDAARRENPGLLEASHPRGDFIERSVVFCEEPILGEGVRNPRDAAILADLSKTVDAVASQLVAEASSRSRTWLVESHHPNAAVVQKISFAT